MVLNLKKTNLWLKVSFLTEKNDFGPKNDIFVQKTIILKFSTEIFKTTFSNENWKRAKLQSV